VAKGPGGFVSGGNDPLKAPDAPTVDSVSVTDIAKVDVTFSAPLNAGDGRVDLYVITAKQGDGASSSTTASSAGTVSLNLTAGGTTTFAAQAISDQYGPGAFSGYSNSTTVFGGAELYATGDGVQGRLGTDNVIDQSSPVQVGSLTDWFEVDAGNNFAAALKTDGTLWAWGDNNQGQLGDGSIVDKSSPVQVGALTNWSQISAGNDHCLAVKTDGTLWAWGDNATGELGIGGGGDKNSPVQVGALTNWSKVSAGSGFSMAITTDGELYAWGNAANGRLGTNTDQSVDINSPVQVGALTDWYKIFGTHAIKTDGTLWGWGSADVGQLGDNQYNNDRSSPVQIGALTNWATASPGGLHTLAVKTDGTLWAWGEAQNGRLGDNQDLVNRSSPVQIGALTDWSLVSATGGALTGFSTAIKTDGTLWAWGRNNDGELGDGTTVQRSSPVQIGALTDWVKVSAQIGTYALLGVTS